MTSLGLEGVSHYVSFNRCPLWLSAKGQGVGGKNEKWDWACISTHVQPLVQSKCLDRTNCCWHRGRLVAPARLFGLLTPSSLSLVMSVKLEILLFLSVPSVIFSTNTDLIKTENHMQVNKAIVYSYLCIHIDVFAYIIYPVITNSTNISQWKINLIS